MRNKKAWDARLANLRTSLSGRSMTGGAATAEPAGSATTFARRALHDLYARTPADAVALNAFGLGLAVEAAQGRPVVWALHRMTEQEAGRPYAPGLNEMGLRPEDVLLVRVKDIQTLLGVGEEALRSPAVGAVVLSAWGEAKAMTLTASRRLSLAARASGATVFLARAGAAPSPSAAETRWSIGVAPSEPLEANAPGRPVFSATLLRHRGGFAPRTWIMEWDRERRSFVEPAPLSGGLVSLAAFGPAGAGDAGERRRVA